MMMHVRRAAHTCLRTPFLLRSVSTTHAQSSAQAQESHDGPEHLATETNPYKHIYVKKIAGAVGAEVGPVDLSEPLLSDVKAEILDAYAKHSLLVFRDQQLTPAGHLSFARLFGEPEPHPVVAGLPDYPDVLQIVKEPGAPTRFGEVWHSDNSYQHKPTSTSILRGVEVPPWGNDTLFSSQYAAYEGLSEGLKETLAPLRAIHTAGRAFSFDAHRKENFEADSDSGKMKYQMSSVLTEEVPHPVVRVHPATGRPALYVNSMFTIRFEGWSEEESLPLLRYLWEHCARPEYTCRISWRPGTVIMWDNRCLQHLAIGDNWEHRRVMQRVTIQGERPLAAFPDFHP